MKFMRLTAVATILLFAALVGRAAAEVVYTRVNVSIPVGGTYNIDVEQDGFTDFTLRSSLLQDYCQFGDGYVWILTVTPANGGGVVTDSGNITSSDAAALQRGVTVNVGQSFYAGTAVMAGLDWGFCGTGALGEWLNSPNRYLGLQVKDAANNVHYGWAKVSTTAFVDQYGTLHASTVLSGFAYETTPNQGILAGQISADQSPQSGSLGHDFAPPTTKPSELRDAGQAFLSRVTPTFPVATQRSNAAFHRQD
jgi:hypothetical protein